MSAASVSPRLKTACRKLTAPVSILVLGDFNRRLTLEHDRVWRELADGQPAPIMLATRLE